MSLLSYLKGKVQSITHLHGKDEKEPAFAVMDAVEADLDTIRDDVMEFAKEFKAWMLQDPEKIFAILRRIKPILHLKSRNLVVVTRYDDVREVLMQDDVFYVTYAEKMTALGDGRNFFLGMQNTSDYQRDVSNMRIAAAREDVAKTVVPGVDREAEQLVANAQGRIDVAQQLARTVATRTVVNYFGASAHDEKQQSDWAHKMFQFLFTDRDNDPQVRKDALEAGRETRNYLEEAIADRKSRRGSRDDVLERCLRLQDAQVPGMDDIGIRNNLLGLIVGAIPTTAKAATFALDELLNRPAQLTQAQAAARANQDDLLAQYVFEALRFRPINPGLVRLASEDYMLSKGNLRATLIPKGTAVLAVTQSAMRDEREIDQADEFRVDRPSYHYLHFGFGMHTCFGQHINREQIPRILKPLLKRSNLRRAAGDEGQLVMEGPFPSRLVVEFDS